jgi:hypothetical protein
VIDIIGVDFWSQKRDRSTARFSDDDAWINWARRAVTKDKPGMRQVDLVKAVRRMLKEWREQLGARWGAVTLFVASATNKAA